MSSLELSPEVAAWAALELRLHALGELVRILERAQIASLPIKGALLARQLYDSPAERPLVDVDLLVRRRDFGQTVRIARNLGFPLVWDSKQLGNVNIHVNGIAVDVACTLGPPGTSKLDVDTVLKRAARTHRILGFPHWQIELHDHALVVAIDAFKDKLGAKPSSRQDLLRLAKEPGFDPQKLVRVAREARLETLVRIVAAWLLETDDSPPWKEVLSALEARPERRIYARMFRLLSRRPSTLTRIPLAVLARAASDEFPTRVAALGAGALGTLVFLARNRGLTPRKVVPGRGS